MKKSKLYILPNILHIDQDIKKHLPPIVFEIVEKLDGLICESQKEGIRFLIKCLPREKANALALLFLNEHSNKEQIDEIIKKISQGEKWGLISDCGMPIIADPGSELISLLEKKGIEIEAVIGPSSIIYAMLLSGFSNQRFSFHGYLPRELDPLKKQLLKIEKDASYATQIWIEAPYRFKKILQICLETLSDETKLCVAINLQSEKQQIINHSISKWKKLDLSIFEKKALPVFLIKKNSP